MNLPEYLDFAASTKVDPRIAELMMRIMVEGFGNSGSRTHKFGSDARGLVEEARLHVAKVCASSDDEVIFTSGATEANNIALLGIAPFGEKSSRKHIIVSKIEHKAVLEPAEFLQGQGFDVQTIGATEAGQVNLDQLASCIREDTLMVSIMHVNNETGVIQPLSEISEILKGSESYLHVDAAQGFGKEFHQLSNERIDLISLSGHKLYAPQGVGALVVRKRSSGARAPLSNLIHGGGQERGLRPGTVSVPLVVALGEAARLAKEERELRFSLTKKFEKALLEFVERAGGVLNGDRAHSIPHIVNASFRGLDSEAFILATKSTIAVSNGAACSSHAYERSHVLQAMGIDEWRIAGGVRFSFSHDSNQPDWDALLNVLESVRL
jgi:cysteine desulfurase